MRSLKSCSLAVCLVLAVASQSHAGLTLTPAGAGQGFTLTTFASGFPTVGSGTPGFADGPFGIGFPAGGAVLVLDIFGDMRRFPTDTDGQTAAAAPITYMYGNHDPQNPIYNPGDIAASGGNLYITLSHSDLVVQINADGTFNQNIASVSATPDAAAGIAVNPVNGHLFVSVEDASNSVVDVDPIAKTVTPFVSTVQSPDGMTFNASGSILYVSTLDQFLPGRVVGFDVVTKAQVFDSGIITGGPDGLAIGTGALAGNLFVNTNDGRVVEINLATHVQTEIANGGSRGDFVKVDPNNGTLLLIQSDSIVRLTPPPGGGFEGAVPEPSTLTICSLLVLGSAVIGFRRRALG